MKGLSLIELTISMAIASVGSLAVFTLFLHLDSQLVELKNDYPLLQKEHLNRPQTRTDRRFTFSQCTIEQAGLIIE